MVIWQTFITVEYYNLKKQYEVVATSNCDLPKSGNTTTEKVETKIVLSASVISLKVENDYTVCRLDISNLDNTIMASELLIEVYLGLDTKQLFICSPEFINTENSSKKGDSVYEIKFPNNDCNEIFGKITDLKTSRVAIFKSLKEDNSD